MNKPERLVERIRKYLKNNDITPYEFEKKVEVANGYLNKQAAGKGTVGSEVLEKIHRQYPALNILWLLTGEGEMEIDVVTDEAHRTRRKTAHPTTQPTAHLTTVQIEASNQITILKAHLENTKTSLEVFKQQNETLKASIIDKDKIIALLEEQLNVVKTKG